MRDGEGCLHSEKAKYLDMFGSSMGFNFSEKSADYRSWVGSLATILIFILTLTATVQNVIILHNRDGTMIIEALNVK